MTKSPEKVPRSMGSGPSWFGPPGPIARPFCPVRTRFRTYRLVLGILLRHLAAGYNFTGGLSPSIEKKKIRFDAGALL
jgi:hypothetical protein